jgi:3-hydroxybutyryl-CoA dehydrogenase
LFPIRPIRRKGMEIKKVGVIGCGAMGSGIVQVCAQSGYNVVVLEMNEQLLEKGLSSIESFLNKGVEKGKMTLEGKNAILKKIQGTVEYREFSTCDLVVEAVQENMEVKQNVFEELDRICPHHAILGTNTSSLSIIDIASATRRPEKVIGLHFMNPVPLMKLLEIVRSVATSEEVLEICREFGKSLGKTVIIAKDSPGFIVNYLQYPFRLNAIRMLEAGMATREDIDAAATLGLGHPMGPLALQDLVGLDVTYAGALSVYEETGDPKFLPPVLMKKMIAAGWLGRKSGKGFYTYKKPE